MDFKSLISKINSMADPIETVKAPVLPQAVQLNEDAQMRVLAGQTTVLAEAKKQEAEKKEKAVKEEMDVGDSKKTAKGGTVTKTKTGIVHKAAPGVYGGSDDKDTDPDADEHPADKKAKKAKKESIDAEAFKGKFAKMVEAKKENKKETMKKAAKDTNNAKGVMKDMFGGDAKDLTSKLKIKEGAKPDFLDVDKDGDKKEPMKKAAAGKGGDKPAGKKGMSAKQEKFFGKKKTVKESVEGKLTFKDMVKLVQESGGQQQIDAKDDALFQWAQRVAVSKLGEGVKAELYAGLIYERNGGVFEMYDVLSETK